MKTNPLLDAALVLALAALFGGALSGVEVLLKPRIEANRLNETVGQIPQLVPGAVSGISELSEGRRVFRAVDAAQQTLGWVLPVGGQGFCDRIELLVALDVEATTITGLYVLDQKETPGLGNRIVELEWRQQFAGKSAATALVVTKHPPSDPEEIHGVTGATISSDIVVDIVNRATREFRAARAAQPGPGTAIP